MKVLFIADLHVKLGQKSVPVAWQKRRFSLLAEELNKLVGVDLLVIGGDLFDSPDYTSEEFELAHSFLTSLKHKILLYAGNHEMVSGKVSVFSHLKDALQKAIPHIQVITEGFTSKDFDVIPYEILHGKWPEPVSKLCFTHVRGEIPPHVKPEVDLAKFSNYSLVVAGDLHSYTNSQRNILYPGSPMTTSFHRKEVEGSNGYLLIDTDTLEYSWYELYLPQLLRFTVNDPALIVPHDYHHAVYELVGSANLILSTKPTSILEKTIVEEGEMDDESLEITDDLITTVISYLRCKGVDNDTIERVASLTHELTNASITKEA